MEDMSVGFIWQENLARTKNAVKAKKIYGIKKD